MTPTDPTDENVSTHSVRPTYILACRDDQGCDHVYRTTDETVLVIYDGRVRQRVDLDAYADPLARLTIEDYLGQLAAHRDIERVDLEHTVVDALERQLAEAM